MKDIKQIIADNLISLRKKHNLTQNELATKLNYSDNTISRWERAEITPSVESLQAISEIYNVPLEFLIKENIKENIKLDDKTHRIKRLATILLCVSLVWFMAIIAFFYAETFFSLSLWTLFIWAVPASCMVLLFFNKYLINQIFQFVISTIGIWTLLLSFYLQFLQYNMYLIFFIGVPAQVALCIWTFIRPNKKKEKLKEKLKEKQKNKKEENEIKEEVKNN